MDLTFSEEQEELRRTVRRFLEESFPVSETRRIMASPEHHDPALWKRMALDLGLLGLPIPEEYGGAGLGFIELALVCQEMGRLVLCAPFLSTVCLAVPAILETAPPAQQVALLPPIAAGEYIVTLAVAEPAGDWTAEGIATTCRRTDDGWVLRGTKAYVTDGVIADGILVAARHPDTEGERGVGLFLVAGDAPRLSRTEETTLDPTRPLGTLMLEDVPGEPVGQLGEAWPALERALQRSVVCLSAEAVGGAERCLEMAVEYAKVREQFGRPIGSFQAIKHKCADMLVEVEAARSTLLFAAWAAASSPEELPLASSLTKARCGDAYFRVAGDNIQVHGGIGYTFEHDAQLYFKRAVSTQFLLGDAVHHRDVLAGLAGA